MSITDLDETYMFEISIKIRFIWCNYWYQNSIFRVSVTIEPGRSLLQYVTTNCLILKWTEGNYFPTTRLPIYRSHPINFCRQLLCSALLKDPVVMSLAIYTFPQSSQQLVHCLHIIYVFEKGTYFEFYRPKRRRTFRWVFQKMWSITLN